MTGYARAERRSDGRRVTVEIRSVNHKYCEVVSRLPREWGAMESEVKRLVQNRFSRGRFEVSLAYEGIPQDGRRLSLDLGLLRQYYRLLKRAQKELGLPGTIEMSHLLGCREALVVSEEPHSARGDWTVAEQTLRTALGHLEKMRETEGGRLGRDIQQRLRLLQQRLARVRQRVPLVVAAYEQRLKERLKQLTGGIPLDAVRLAQEVAHFAERSDITEEVVRLESHFSQMRALLRAPEPVGKKLEFLLQEINREVNTLGAKANDAEISLEVVSIKDELERIREQAQNLE
jgi:uncharacterized protein (TIGR00255 family)